MRLGEGQSRKHLHVKFIQEGRDSFCDILSWNTVAVEL
jgi:hypothetical protein